MIAQHYSVINFELSNEAVREFPVMNGAPAAAFALPAVGVFGDITIAVRGEEFVQRRAVSLAVHLGAKLSF